MLQFRNFNGSLFHSFGAAVLNALSPKGLYLVLGTDNSLFESDCKEREGQKTRDVGAHPFKALNVMSSMILNSIRCRTGSQYRDLSTGVI